MAFDDTPTELFSGMSEDGTDLTIPLASLPELTEAEADAVTGDSRKIAYALAMRLFNWYDGLDEADKPGKLSFFKNGPNTTGSTTKTTFTFEFEVDASAIDVADES